jgi:hypothetical protein
MKQTANRVPEDTEYAGVCSSEISIFTGLHGIISQKIELFTIFNICIDGAEE